MLRHKFSKEEVDEYHVAHGTAFVYFNPQDSNIVVPKVVGIGFTFNFGHPVAWVVLAAIVALIIWRTVAR